MLDFLGCNDVCLASLCTEINLIDLFLGMIKSIQEHHKETSYYSFFIPGACSHRRVNDFYVESIYKSQSGTAFLSKKCESWEDFQADKCPTDVGLLQMGEALSLNKYTCNWLLKNHFSYVFKLF